MPRHATPRHATPRHATPCHAIPCQCRGVNHYDHECHRDTFRQKITRYIVNEGLPRGPTSTAGPKEPPRGGSGGGGRRLSSSSFTCFGKGCDTADRQRPASAATTAAAVKKERQQPLGVGESSAGRGKKVRQGTQEHARSAPAAESTSNRAPQSPAQSWNARLAEHAKTGKKDPVAARHQAWVKETCGKLRQRRYEDQRFWHKADPTEAEFPIRRSRKSDYEGGADR